MQASSWVRKCFSNVWMKPKGCQAFRFVNSSADYNVLPNVPDMSTRSQCSQQFQQRSTRSPLDGSQTTEWRTVPRVFRCRLQMIQRPGDPCQATSLYTWVVQLPAAAEANPQFQYSTMEAGYMAIAASGQDALWWHLFCVELNSLTTTTEIRCDNRCAMSSKKRSRLLDADKTHRSVAPSLHQGSTRKLLFSNTFHPKINWRMSWRIQFCSPNSVSSQD